ncbi:MAG: hypothetical protein KAI29_10885, partial [Cyclobacteriaceae bacterium]|nr:hypothetical protein [Cyclobacteriaceae bacterium]
QHSLDFIHNYLVLDLSTFADLELNKKSRESNKLFTFNSPNNSVYKEACLAGKAGVLLSFRKNTFFKSIIRSGK